MDMKGKFHVVFKIILSPYQTITTLHCSTGYRSLQAQRGWELGNGLKESFTVRWHCCTVLTVKHSCCKETARYNGGKFQQIK